jgi:hypothetical protein
MKEWILEPWAGTCREVCGDYWVYEDGDFASDLPEPFACAYYKDKRLSEDNISWDDPRCIDGKDMLDVAKELCAQHAREHGKAEAK